MPRISVRSKYPSRALNVAASFPPDARPAPRSLHCLSVAALRDLQAGGARGLPGGVRRPGGLLPAVAPGVLRVLPVLRAPRRPHLLLEERGRLVRASLLREPPAALRRLRRGRDRPPSLCPALPACAGVLARADSGLLWRAPSPARLPAPPGMPSGSGILLVLVTRAAAALGSWRVPKENGVKQCDVSNSLG